MSNKQLQIDSSEICCHMSCVYTSVCNSLLQCIAWLEHCPGPMEAAAHQYVDPVDGRKLHLSLPHHDGGYDVSEASPDLVQL